MRFRILFPKKDPSDYWSPETVEHPPFLEEGVPFVEEQMMETPAISRWKAQPPA